MREASRLSSISVTTPYPDLWSGPTDIRHCTESDATLVDYDKAISVASSDPRHFISGYTRAIESILGQPIPIHDLRPCLKLHEIEKSPPFQIKRPYWVMMAGSKRDCVTKQWDPAKWRQLVKMLFGRVTFVSAGTADPVGITHKIEGAIDLVGRTSIRELLRLIAMSEGVVCGITSAMHIAAAFNKPCVVIAGGREPWWWEAYTNETWELTCVTKPPSDFVQHVYFHSIGELECCKYSGCGRCEVVGPDLSQSCVNVVQGPSCLQPQCLHSVTTDEVVSAITDYAAGTRLRTTTAPRHRHKHLRDPITVAVLLYGDDSVPPAYSHYEQTHKTCFQLHQRVLDSITGTADPDLIDLRIGCNAVGPETTAYLEDMRHRLPSFRVFYEPINIGKEPLMRRLFAADERDTATLMGVSLERLQQIINEDMQGGAYRSRVAEAWHQVRIDLRTEWLAWFDDDTYVLQKDWLSRLDTAIGSRPDCVGYIRGWQYDTSQIDWMTKSWWWKNRPITAEFCTGGFWACRTDVLRTLDWPDPRLWHHNDDVVLGVALHQNNYRLLNLTDQIVQIEDVERRGWSLPAAHS